MTKKHKISKHGTLGKLTPWSFVSIDLLRCQGEGDVTGAQPIRVSQVVLNCDDSNFKDYFGGAGELPPVSVVHS